MKDRIPTYPGRVRLTPVPGQENVYDMERADQPRQDGTPLNKNTLLTDETAGAMGLTGDPTVNEALGLLVRRALVDAETAAELGMTADGATVSRALMILAQANGSILQAVSSGVSMGYQTYVGEGADVTKTFDVGGTPVMMVISEEGGTVEALRFYKGLTYAMSGEDRSVNTSTVWGDNSVTVKLTSAVGNRVDKTYHVMIAYAVKKFDGEMVLTVTTENGTPVPDCEIVGLYSILGTGVTTDSQGVARGYGANGETCTISPTKYADLADHSFVLAGLTDGTTARETKTLSRAAAGTIKRFTNNVTVQVFSTTVIKAALVGGGSGGAGGSTSDSSGGGGQGGAGGKVYNSGNITLEPGVDYPVVLGMGGAGGAGHLNSPGQGSAGGNTTFAGLSSASGNSETLVFNDASIIAGGAGGWGGSGYYYNWSTSNGETSRAASAGDTGVRAGGKGGTGGSSASVSDATGGSGGESGHVPGGGGGGGGGGANYWRQYQGGMNAPGGPGGPGARGGLFIKIVG